MRVIVLGFAALLLAGCGGGEKLAPVRGKVTLDDKPLAKGTLTFEAPGKRPATATVVNGEITEATTFKAGDGVPLGSHNVAVSATEDAATAVVADPGQGGAPGANYMGGKSLIPAKYNDPATSGLTATIEDKENEVEFKLSTKPGGK